MIPPTLKRNWWTVSRYHWMVRMGNRPSSRRATIRETRLAPNRPRPMTLPPRSALGVRRRSHTGQTRVTKTCSVTSTGATGISMTSRVRWGHPPTNPVPHSGQASKACSIRWEGSVRGRLKPWGRDFLGSCFSAGSDFAPGLLPGIPGRPLPLRPPSNAATRRCNCSMTAC